MTLLEDLHNDQKATGQKLGQAWWHWRHHYLEAKRQPDAAAALVQPIESDLLKAWERVYQSRLTGARQADPTNADIDQSVCDQLIAEADDGFVPLGGEPEQYVQIAPVPTASPWAMPAQATGWTERLRSLPARWRLAAVAALWGIGLLVAGMLLWSAFKPAAHAAPVSASPVASPAPSVQPTPMVDPQSALEALAPSLPGQRETPVPTTLKVGERVYPVATTRVVVVTTPMVAKRWKVSPNSGTASWLAGSAVNMVVCVPSLAGVDGSTPIQVWDQHGTVRSLRVVKQFDVGPRDTSALRQNQTGMTLVACGGATERVPVVVAEYQP